MFWTDISPEVAVEHGALTQGSKKTHSHGCWQEALVIRHMDLPIELFEWSDMAAGSVIQVHDNGSCNVFMT